MSAASNKFIQVRRLDHAPDAELANELDAFERQFSYPLGPGHRFSILHGPDYRRFFSAIGEAAIFIAYVDGAVSGTLGSALRQVRTPQGSLKTVAYLCDLKVSPGPRRGFVLAHLLREAKRALEPAANGHGYAVVMDGTPLTPDRYTGRLGMPGFVPLDQQVILRIPSGDVVANEVDDVQMDEVRALYEALNPGRFLSLGGRPEQRSMQPIRAMNAGDGQACAVLEDTRLGKRLWDTQGGEIISSHLTHFGFNNVDAGSAIIRAARQACWQDGVPAFFVSLQPEQVTQLLTAGDIPTDSIQAHATVFGCALATDRPWSIHSSEI